MPLTSVKGVGREMKNALAVGWGEGNSPFHATPFSFPRLNPQPQVAVCWIKAWETKDRE